MARAATASGVLSLAMVLVASAGSGAAPAAAATAEPGEAAAPVPCWEESPPCGGLEPAAPDAEPESADEGASEEGAPPRIRISRSSGHGRPVAADMVPWHRTYRRATAAVDAALGQLLAVRAVDRPAYWGPSCRRLARALVALDRHALFPAPDLAADVHLKRTLDRLAEAAMACLDGRFTAADYHLEEAARARSEFRLALRRYGLRE